MKHTNYVLTILTCILFFSSSLSYGKGLSSENAKIKIFKEQNNQWMEIKRAPYDVNNNVLQLEYDTYYTIQVSDVTDLNMLKNIAAILGTTKEKKQYHLPFDQTSSTKQAGMEDYFTELPFALVSYSQKNVNNKNVYTVLMKTKSKEMILK